MENNNVCTKYSDKMIYYTPYCAIFGAVCNLIFFKRIKTGFLIGLGIGAGYCHNEFKSCFKTIFLNDKMNITYKIPQIN
jgi:hypothetical protein